MSDRLAEIARVQDDIWRALKEAPRHSGAAIEAARAQELDDMAAKAAALGVSFIDYRNWCAGADLRHVKDAVLKSQK